MTMVTGSYRIIGASPDGDSIRFYPDDPSIWTQNGIVAKANASGGVQLRLDAIDALETHYTPPHAAGAWHQPAELGQGAAKALLDLLGFADVVRDERGYVTSATPEQTTGYILTRFADKYGRPVATAYPGTPPASPGTDHQVYLDIDALRASVNYQLLDAGWVYPTFYSKLYFDLRTELAAVAIAARNAELGVWARDATLPGFTLTSRDELSDQLVILPKLFRRLAEYLTLDETGGIDLAGFSTFLAAHGDTLFTVPAGQSTSLDTLVQVDGQTVRLTLAPEQIVFIEG